MARKLRRITIACGVMMGAAAMFLVLLAAMAPTTLAGPDQKGGLFAATADGPCGEAIGFDTWITCTAMITGHSGAAAAAVGDVILVMGGSQGFVATSTVQAYSTVSDTWSLAASMPISRSGLAAAMLDDEVYAIGGWTTTIVSPTAASEVYEPISDTWAAVAPLPAPRGDLAAVAVGGKVYALGGASGYNSVTDTVTSYDPISDTWSYCAPMPTARSGLAAVAVGDKIYAIGGRDGSSALAVVEVYDTVSDSWGMAASMPITRSGLAAAVVDGKIYAVGGTQTQFYPASYLDANEQYDPTTDTWLAVAPMPTPRHGLVAVSMGRKVYAIGGSSEANTSEAANEVYLVPATTRVLLPLVLRCTGD